MSMPKKIVILGSGTAGWMAANLFVKKWAREQVSVRLIESQFDSFTQNLSGNYPAADDDGFNRGRYVIAISEPPIRVRRGAS